MQSVTPDKPDKEQKSVRYGKLGTVLVGLGVASFTGLLAHPLSFAQLGASAEQSRATEQKARALPTRLPRTKSFLPSAANFVGNFGTAIHDAGFVTSLTITNNGTTTGVAGGDSIIVALSTGSSGATGAVSCSDTQGNTYTVDVDIPVSSTTPRLAICSAHNVIALSGADTITVTFPSNGNSERASANEFSGLTPISPLDQT